ncbi:MAG: helix-turn-helix domain-containing protein [Clostridia bacterium]|nr:helix-turn-helix domain-containing protein [Clostridia bacterium]
MLNQYNNELTIDDVAEILNYNQSTIYRLMSNGVIPYFKKGNTRYVHKYELIYMLIHS